MPPAGPEGATEGGAVTLREAVDCGGAAVTPGGSEETLAGDIVAARIGGAPVFDMLEGPPNAGVVAEVVLLTVKVSRRIFGFSGMGGSSGNADPLCPGPTGVSLLVLYLC